jgi:hypothetical protein
LVGMTGFEPATTRPPDDYCKSHYNLEYQYNAYLPFLWLTLWLTLSSQTIKLVIFHRKDNHYPLHRQHYHSFYTQKM